MKQKKILLDTSVIINGFISEMLGSGEIADTQIIVPRVVVAELQNQASKGLEIGFRGLEELKKIREICQGRNIPYYIRGPLPTVEDIKLAHSGRIDELILELSKKLSATLYTSDYVMHLVAQAEGISSRHLVLKIEKGPMKIEKYIGDDVLSVHLKEGVPPYIKRGKPGNFRLVRLSKEPLSGDLLEEMIAEINERARSSEDSFIEMKMGGATVIQMGNYRITVARPPFSDGLELTLVRPLVKLTLNDYHISEVLRKRIETAEGIIISGPPGSGKSTLAASLAEFYMNSGKVVKTFESPRDLQVGPEITQYAPLEGDFEKTAEILLLVRPDYTIFDEVRKTKDFMVYADMRLAGVGMVGVVHSSSPIDAVQRLIERIDIGITPRIVDTVIFVTNGEIKSVYELGLSVRVPAGMTSDDLARPVVEVRNFDNKKLEYEIYMYGDERVVVPVSGQKDRIEELVSQYDREAIVEVGKKSVIIRASRDAFGRLIGKNGENIDKLENQI
ncbi:MAG: Flp pilus assembly complex ATPase component TadA [Thaumarchaeota archaeon]|nr:Flp pilus assembly complex ATPase component TadA [Nitrososphaerota archaeon]